MVVIGIDVVLVVVFVVVFVVVVVGIVVVGVVVGVVVVGQMNQGVYFKTTSSISHQEINCL